jgi:hypothetical protein
MAKSNLVTSAHAVCYINNIPFARCCGLSFDIASPKKPIHGVDVLEPVELIPIGLSVNGTIQVYRMRDDGGTEVAGLQATWAKMTRGKYFSLMVLDRSTDNVIIQVDKCDVTNQSWHVTPKTLVTGTIAFTGFGYSNISQ